MEELIKNTIIKSQEKLKLLKDSITETYNNEKYNKIIVYVCGSLARNEMVESSDLDLFFIDINEKPQSSNLEKYTFFSKMYEINKSNHFQDPSKQGYYWDFIPQNNLLDIGSREEDFNNSFTARMLLILESKPLLNETNYEELLNMILDKYFEDYNEHSEDFYPLFLMNDILRYWYTLTLNYEYRKDPNDNKTKRYWKRLKLKYARLLTCFSFIACLCSGAVSKNEVLRFIHYTRFERLDYLAEKFSELLEIVIDIKQEYAYFIQLHSENSQWWEDETNKKTAFSHAENFHSLLIHQLLKKVVEKNPTLQNKIDMF